MAGVAGFVGRKRELAFLRAALGGDTRMVLVVGDAGLGKTRFAEEGMRRAAAGGTVPVWGRCLPLAEKLPLLPVAGALGELSRLDGSGLLEAALTMVPCMCGGRWRGCCRSWGPAARAPAAGAGGGGVSGCSLGLLSCWGAVSRRSGLALVVEDVHWADGATLDCLTYLTSAGRGGAVTVVATCRADEAPLDRHATEWLAHVRGGDAVEEIRLGALSRGEVAEQIAGLVGGPAPPGFAEDLYARAEGNPFFTEQLVAAALARWRGAACRPPARPAARPAPTRRSWLTTKPRRC